MICQDATQRNMDEGEGRGEMAAASCKQAVVVV